MNKWIKITLVILGFALISVLAYLILNFLGITSINKLQKIIANSGPLAIIVYILISAILLTLLCFVPLLNSSLSILSLILFPTPIAFVGCLLATLLSNTMLFFIGDKFGEKVATKLVTKEELENVQNLIDKKSKILLPLIFILPGIPDEALCLIAGMTKMKYSYLISVSAIYHSIEIGLYCFIGSGLIDWAVLSLFDWIILINILIIDLYFLFKLEKKIK